MLQHLRHNVVGYLALFVALSGTAYAASLPKNSVGTKQLKNRAVTAAKIAPGVVPHVPTIAWAIVDADGTIAGKRGLTSVKHTGKGAYTVTFHHSAVGCAVTASPSVSGGGSLAQDAVNTTTQLSGVVTVWTGSGGLAVNDKTEAPFTIVELCP